jgi:hypothetical protein
MENLSGSFEDHLIPRRLVLVLALIAGVSVLCPVHVWAEAPDGVAGGSCGFACGGESLHPAAAFLGAWHVLVHYEDAASSGAARERWEDRAWVFEREGDRLRWTEYPIVVFEDETGRFESDGTNRASRTHNHWQPDEAQLADIKDGFAVNERGVASVTLRVSEESWVSGPKQAAPSASMILYDEVWRIDPAAEGPVFTREDALRSERAEDLTGVTIYTTRATADGGRQLMGDFERDGAQRGTFSMTRAAGVHGHGD